MTKDHKEENTEVQKITEVQGMTEVQDRTEGQKSTEVQDNQDLKDNKDNKVREEDGIIKTSKKEAINQRINKKFVLILILILHLNNQLQENSIKSKRKNLWMKDLQ